MKYIIEIESETQPGLMHQIEEAKARLTEGGSYLNQSNFHGRVQLRPESEATEEEMLRQWRAAHPKPTAAWK